MTASYRLMTNRFCLIRGPTMRIDPQESAGKEGLQSDSRDAATGGEGDRRDLSAAATALLDDPVEQQLSQVWFFAAGSPPPFSAAEDPLLVAETEIKAGHCKFQKGSQYLDTTKIDAGIMSRELVLKLRRFWKLFGGGIAVWTDGADSVAGWRSIAGVSLFHWLVAEEAEFEDSAATPHGAWGCGKPGLFELWTWQREDDGVELRLEGMTGGDDVLSKEAATTGGSRIMDIQSLLALRALRAFRVAEELFQEWNDFDPMQMVRCEWNKSVYTVSATWEDVDGIVVANSDNDKPRGADDACEARKKLRGRLFVDGGFTKLSGYLNTYAWGRDREMNLRTGSDRYVVNVAAWLDGGRGS
eukprot:CAMPEP_0178983756 /NCGR_PEP_ID=MMETSP0795-20121207/1236_1 /TAXON_ID=88552 /ORGANISM="Amoebophrya sp., Strain Ameob2" /LENGTH=356 /DNA_ID=CAMNT_0020674563 /DNA_START=223 /DNA_END=1295 /DNA_ORIENTATION=-